jgi:hypothetical protein
MPKYHGLKFDKLNAYQGSPKKAELTPTLFVGISMIKLPMLRCTQ